MQDELPESYLVEYGTTEIADGTNGEKIAYVEKLIWHEDYDNDELNDDIGLVKVKTALEISFSDFRIRLPVKGSYVSSGSPAVLAGKNFLKRFQYEPLKRISIGWGRIASNEPISTVLQKVDLRIYSRYDCAQIHNPDWILPNNICAGVSGGGMGQCSGELSSF